MSNFVLFTLIGLGTGACYSLVALALVVTYRGSGLINFATGAQALFGAAVYAELSKSMSRPLSAAVALVTSAVVGGLIHLLVMRPLRNASPLVRVVATLALLGFVEQAAFKRYGVLPPAVEGILPANSIKIAGATIGEDRIWLFGIGLVLYAIVFLAYRMLRVGLATTGVAENEMATATMGWSPDLVATLNWALGGLLAGLAGVLLVPITGLQSSSLALAVVPALAAGVLGQFKSFPIVLVGSLLIGVLQAQAIAHISQPGWSNAIPFIVIILVLVVRGHTLPLRSHLTDRLPRLGTGALRPLPIAIAIAAAVALASASPNWAGAVTTSAITAILCLSVVVVTGYAGQLSLAQMGVSGLGALIAAQLAANGGVPFLGCLVIAALAAIPLGIIVALPAVRVRGVNLAVVTMGLSVVISGVILGSPALTGGVVKGLVLPAPKLFGWEIFTSTHPQRYAWVVIGVLVICLLPVANLRRSHTGRRLIAVRDNERAAASLGVHVVASKLFAFGLSSALASAAGVLLVFELTFVNFDSYDVFHSINIIVLGVIGGVGSLLGAAIGGFSAPDGVVQGFFNIWFSVSGYYPLIAAGALIPVVIMTPDGAAAALVATCKHIGQLTHSRVNIPSTWLRHRRDRLRTGAASATPISTITRVKPQSLELTDLEVRFGGTTVLNKVSLTVRPGQVVGLIGPNGAGKTTLIDAVTGYVPLTNGTVVLDGQRIDRFTASRRATHGLTRSFQSLELFEDLTVRENISVGARPKHRWTYITDLFRASRLELTQSAIAAVHEFGLEEVLDQLPSELGYAQRRLVAIARSVACAPSILLLDEPAAGLDEESTQELSDLIRVLAHDWGMGILLIEHDVPMVFATCDTVAAINFGWKVSEGTPAEVRQDADVRASYLGEAETEVPAARATVSVVERVPHGTELHVVGRGNGTGRAHAVTGDAVLEAVGISAGYNGTAVVHGLNIQVRPGEMVALLGSNGAGKSTSLLTLAGGLKPLDGEIRWAGTKTTAPLHRRARAGLSFVPEQRCIIPGLSTRDNLRLGMGPTGAALEAFPELERLLGRRAGLLSGGEQQILSVARALATSPKLLMADELSLGLAPKIVDRLLAALREAADAGIGVLLVEQRFRQVLEVADRAIVLSRGRVVMEGSAETIRNRLSEVEIAYFTGTGDRVARERKQV